jgi:geranylgeranyl pyrophosphate synthase
VIIQTITEDFFAPVQDLMPKVEKRMRPGVDRIHPDLGAALDHLFTSGGKRIRPTMTLLTGGMFGGDTDKIVTLAAAIELLHTATLVHDDLIDGSLLRRGIATLNAQWSPAVTVLAGDYVFARAAELSAQTDSVEVMKMFARTLTTIVNGEITQLYSRQNDINLENYKERIYAKTASLFEVACSAAAVISTADDHTREIARQIGYTMGMAFQIVDDLLDFTGEQSTVGKPVASDLRQGLITLPTILYLEKYPDKAESIFLASGNKNNDAEFDQIVIAIRESEAIQQALEEAKRYIDQCVSLLKTLPESTEREAMISLANYITNRSV